MLDALKILGLRGVAMFLLYASIPFAVFYLLSLMVMSVFTHYALETPWLRNTRARHFLEAKGCDGANVHISGGAVMKADA
jgi:hypothetical protein